MRLEREAQRMFLGLSNVDLNPDTQYTFFSGIWV